MKREKSKLIALLQAHMDAWQLPLAGFGGGFVVGYLAGRYATGFPFLSIYRPIEGRLFSILDFSPNVNFLSDVAAFEAVIIALAIPLSFEIVSRISERYKSEVIIRRFEQEWVNRYMPIILLVNIILTISLRFYTAEIISETNEKWRILSWMIFAAFLGVGYLLWKFIKTLRKYVSSTGPIIEDLLKDARETIQKK